jgi:hypothetical protein
MTMQWYFPSWNGDVRVESDPEDPRRSLLTVIEPTAHELELLDQANAVFRAKKWVHSSTKLWKLSADQTRQQTVVDASLLEVGLILLGRLKPGVATLTAITTEEGKVEAMGSSESGFLAWVGSRIQGDAGATPTMLNLRDEEGYARLQLAKKEAKRREEEAEKAKVAAAEAIEEAKKAKDAEIEKAKAKKEAKEAEAKEAKKAKGAKGTEPAAATVKRPTTCCPQSVPGVIEPAQEVLLRFCTPEQREQWLSERRIVAHGGLTGHRYLIAHRHTPTALKIGKCSFDLDDGKVMHFHDWSVPPEEEVLAAKLILEHREPWLRNEATCLGGHSRVFKNPFGNGGDGTHDASFTEAVGDALMALQTVRNYMANA